MPEPRTERGNLLSLGVFYRWPTSVLRTERGNAPSSQRPPYLLIHLLIHFNSSQWPAPSALLRVWREEKAGRGDCRRWQLCADLPQVPGPPRCPFLFCQPACIVIASIVMIVADLSTCVSAQRLHFFRDEIKKLGVRTRGTSWDEPPRPKFLQ